MRKTRADVSRLGGARRRSAGKASPPPREGETPVHGESRPTSIDRERRLQPEGLVKTKQTRSNSRRRVEVKEAEWVPQPVRRSAT